MDTEAQDGTNTRVIAIQRADGIDVGPAWWERNVTDAAGKDATDAQMFDAFMTAYDRDYPKDAGGKRHPLPSTSDEPAE